MVKEGIKKAEKLLEKAKEDLVKELAKDISEEEKKKLSKEKSQKEGLEKAILPSEEKMQEIISKVEAPKNIGSQVVKGLEQTVASAPAQAAEEETPKQTSYQTRPSTTYTTPSAAPSQQDSYVTDGRPIALIPERLKTAREETEMPIKGGFFNTKTPDHFTKPLQNEVYERLEQQQVYSTDSPGGTKKLDPYVPFKEEKEKRMKDLRKL